MAQNSTTILADKNHKTTLTGAVVAFIKTGTEYKISSSNTATVNFGPLAQLDLITTSGSTNNNKTFTVKSVATDGTFVIVEEDVITETAGATITIDHVGFVSNKFKGDGYYSHPDGVHTVAYKVTNTLTGSIKMQGSLATAPSEDDWFDISGSTFTTDQSTLISSANFTGNFVWVRAKATSITAGTITHILLNS